MAAPLRLGVVGAGWRSDFFTRIAAALPDRFTLVGACVRRAAAVEEVAARWGVPVYLSPADLVSHQRPELVISSVPWSANEAVVTELVAAGVRVLSETPPAPDLDAMRRLWAAVGATGRVQVAEQYLLMPGHAARLAVVRSGTIGTPTSVQVSSTHTYHAVSLIRGLLGAGRDPVTVRASAVTAPLVDPLSRDGWTGDEDAKPAVTTLATLDFGEGRSGLYDFTDNQWHNQLRARRIVIRGSRGEISDDSVVRLADARTIVRTAISRSQLGYDLNLDGFDTEHLVHAGEVVYRNPFLGQRWMDEEIAIASLLVATAAWARDDAPPPYPLADGLQDHHIGLAIDHAAATGTAVTTTSEAWAAPGS